MITFPGESPEYRAARDHLLAEEIDLRRRIEAVAASRRALPLGGVVPEDCIFEGADASGEQTRIALSGLFSSGKNTLIVYHMMFPRDPNDVRVGAAFGETAKLPLAAAPCPSCAALLDQLDGVVEHVFTRTNGITRHFWGSELLYARSDPKQDPRHLGLLEPSWNMFDLTPAGRQENWDEQLQYGDACHCASK